MCSCFKHSPAWKAIVECSMLSRQVPLFTIFFEWYTSHFYYTIVCTNLCAIIAGERSCTWPNTCPVLYSNSNCKCKWRERERERVISEFWVQELTFLFQRILTQLLWSPKESIKQRLSGFTALARADQSNLRLPLNDMCSCKLVMSLCYWKFSISEHQKSFCKAQQNNALYGTFLKDN